MPFLTLFPTMLALLLATMMVMMTTAVTETRVSGLAVRRGSLSFVASFKSTRVVAAARTSSRIAAAAASATTSASEAAETKSGSPKKSEEEWLALSKAPLSSLLPNELFREYALPAPPPDVVPLEKGQRVVAFGDVHGDIDALKEFLVVAGVMDPTSSPQDPIWCGGDTICVQTGDVQDRGDDELSCLRLLASLSRQAHEKGGSLNMLYGNHESLNAAGLFQYANEGGNQEYEREIGAQLDEKLGTERWRLQFAGNEPSRWAAFEPGGLLAEPMLSKMKVSMVVGRTVFVHAGLTAEHLREYGGLEGMNNAARDWILQNHHGENNNLGIYQNVNEVIGAAQERSKTACQTMPSCLGGGIGSETPVWMRDYSRPADVSPPYKAQQLLDEALAELSQFGVERMVMGHTPQQHINAALNGKAWRVDVGASQGVKGGAPEVLEIIHGGDDQDDEMNVLTRSGAILSSERQIMELVC